MNIRCFVLVSLFAGLLCYPLHYYTVSNKYVCFSISLALPIIIVCLVVSFIVSCVCCLCCPCCCVYKRRSGGSEYFPCYMCLSVPVLVVSVWLLGGAWCYLLSLLEQKEIINYRDKKLRYNLKWPGITNLLVNKV